VSGQFELFVGVDSAAESHEVCVLDAERRVIDRKAVEHSGAGVALGGLHHRCERTAA